jgi:uncharacterized protein YggT (Ycf19 family)
MPPGGRRIAVSIIPGVSRLGRDQGMAETTGASSEPDSGWLTVAKVARVLLWFVYAWLVVNLVLLVLAFMLRLLGANPTASFVDWVYGSVSRTMAPFRGMFEPLPLGDESVLDTSLLFAMIIYSLAALFLRGAIEWVTARMTPPRPHMVGGRRPAGSYPEPAQDPSIPTRPGGRPGP